MNVIIKRAAAEGLDFFALKGAIHGAILAAVVLVMLFVVLAICRGV